MSLAANIVNQISSINDISKQQSFDLNDDTFAKILEEVNSQNSTMNTIEPLGAPAGFQIEPFDAVEATNEINPVTEPIEIKDIDLSDHFTHLLKNADNNSEFMNFAKKQAANAYNMFGKTFVADIKEFVKDSVSMI